MAEMRRIFLSDPAMSGLINQARHVGYVRGTERVRGLALYMQFIVQNNPQPDQWQDNRPQYIKEDVLNELESGVFSTWDTGELRRPRVFSVRIMNTIDDHVEWLAREIGCIKQNRIKLTKQALISQFWEAVGIGWLAPEVLPSKPPPYTKRKQEKSYELDF